MKRGMGMRKTLTGKISFNFLLIIAITFVLSFFIINSSIKDTVIRLEQKNLSNEVEAVTEKINTNLDAKGMLVKQLANDAALIKFAQDLPSRNVIKTHANYSQVMATLKNAKASNTNDIDMIFFVSEKGDALIKNNEQGVPDTWHVLQRKWYTDTIAKNNTFYTAPYPDATTGKLVVTIAHPMKDSGGKVVGAGAMDILIEDIAKIVENYKIGKNGYIVLMDAQGIVLTHPNKDMISKPMPDSLKQIKEAMNKQARGTVEYEFSGVERIAAYSVVNSSGWRLLAIVPKQDILENVADIQKIIMIVYTIAFITLLFVIIFTMRVMLKQIPDVLAGLDRVRNGDFNTELAVKSEDEIGQIAQAFNNMVKNVKGLLSNAKQVNAQVNISVTELAQVAESANHMSHEISKAIEQTAIATGDQAKNLEVASSHVFELDKKFNKILDNSTLLNKAVKDAEESNKSGMGAVSDLQERNNFTNQASREIEQKVRQLSQKSEAINSILNTITSISAQTNLLALNASIEAARAGEAGRGFAVVANEIRTLAEASANSTNDIKSIIASIQEEVLDSVNKAVQTCEIIEEQNKSVEEVNSVFNKIYLTINSMSKQIDETGNLIHELSKSKDIIVDNITSVSAVAEENAASAEEVTATLNEQATTFNKVYEKVVLLERLARDLDSEINKFNY